MPGLHIQPNVVSIPDDLRYVALSTFVRRFLVIKTSAHNTFHSFPSPDHDFVVTRCI